jgi:hypothetical protein
MWPNQYCLLQDINILRFLCTDFGKFCEAARCENGLCVSYQRAVQLELRIRKNKNVRDWDWVRRASVFNGGGRLGRAQMFFFKKLIKFNWISVYLNRFALAFAVFGMTVLPSPSCIAIE